MALIELDPSERTVGAALRGRPWFDMTCLESGAFKTKGGHGGPPLQYVRWGFGVLDRS